MGDRKRKLEVFEPNGEALAQLRSRPSSMNPYTGRPYSSHYYDILGKRKSKGVISALCLDASLKCWRQTTRTTLFLLFFIL